MYDILKKYIFNLDPEVAHDLAIKSLKLNFLPESLFRVEGEHILETKIFNQTIKNPIGLAAGFDKSAEVYNSLFNFGFGFIEVGTVTPRRQLGNPKPRVFRLEKDKALINRLGFNNHGSEIISKRILYPLLKKLLSYFVIIFFLQRKNPDRGSNDFFPRVKLINSIAKFDIKLLKKPKLPS